MTICSPSAIRENVKSALSRNLPTLKHALRNEVMSIVGGGPSLEDTYQDIRGYIVAVNHAHDFLWGQGIAANLCLMEPGQGTENCFTPERATYYIASMCPPEVFDKLEGHDVVLWHADRGLGFPIADLLPEGTPLIAGGSGTLLHLLDIGLLLGFEAFEIHGFDCSHKGGKHHAYPIPEYREPVQADEPIMGYETKPYRLAQINDFFLRMARGKLDVKLHGDGLLQHLWKERQ